MLRLAIPALLVTITTVLISFVVYLYSVNNGLTEDLANTTSANQSYIDAIAQMDAMQREKEQQIVQRDQSNKQIKRQLLTTKQELENAKKTYTAVEAECMDQPIPPAIIDLLRETPNRVPDSSTDKTVSGSRTVLRNPYPELQWQNLRGYSPIRANASSSYSAVEYRPAVSSRFLRVSF